MLNKQSYKDKQDSSHQGLPQGYLVNGYFDSKGNLFEPLITTWAEEVAKDLGRGYPEMKKHQLRRFYNHAKALERKLDLTFDYDSINADLKILISYVSNAACAKPPKVPRIFEEFIRKNLSYVKDSKSFHGFLDHFQAVVGFCECYLKKD
jgi:CRISPR/Cas system CSM-associated protein Csm2 small subunit